MNEVMKQNKGNEIINKVNEQLSLIDSNTNKIITRAVDEKSFQMKTMTPEKIEQLATMMTEVNRATNSFGKTQSQFMNNVMTVSAHAPYRNLRQILAEVERRRTALKENTYRLKKSMIKKMELTEKLQKLLDKNSEEDKYKIAKTQLKIEEAESGILDARLYIEGALKTIMSYMQAYDDIKKKHNIPDDWDEKDFESEEEEYHIKRAFEQAHADVLATGRITQGNHEYFRQCGINPQNAQGDLMSYMAYEEQKMQQMAKGGDDLQTLNIGIESFADFLNNMAKKYKGASRIILELKGINPDGFYDDALFMDKNFQL